MPTNFLWAAGTDGYISPARQAVTGTTATSTALTALSPVVTAPKGALVMGSGIPTPDFITAGISASSTATLLAATTASASGVAINFLGAPVLIGGEASALASGAAVTSSYWNNTGIIRGVTDLNQADLGSVFFMAGGAFTPAVGGVLAGWWLPSIDGGTTFETLIATPSTTVMALPRAPDFIIALDNAAHAAGNIRFASGRIVNPPPETSFKAVVQNLSGVAMPATWCVAMGGAAVQY